VLFDPQKIALATSWLIPMSALSDVSVQQAGKFALTPSPSMTSNDRYRTYRNDNPQNLADALIAAINDPRTVP